MDNFSDTAEARARLNKIRAEIEIQLAMIDGRVETLADFQLLAARYSAISHYAIEAEDIVQDAIQNLSSRGLWGSSYHG